MFNPLKYTTGKILAGTLFVVGLGVGIKYLHEIAMPTQEELIEEARTSTRVNVRGPGHGYYLNLDEKGRLVSAFGADYCYYFGDDESVCPRTKKKVKMSRELRRAFEKELDAERDLGVLLLGGEL